MSRYSYSFDPDNDNNTAAAVYRAALAGGPRVLDLGSGPGIVAARLATHDGRVVTCADADSAALAEAKAAGVQEIVELDLRDDGWASLVPQRGYDVVILADVLEHLVEPEHVLRTLIKEQVIADDGLLVVSYPNIAHESIIMELLTGNFEYRETGLLDSTHLRFFTRKSMQSLLESAGFMVVETHRTSRTAEQTSSAHRALELPSPVRDGLASLGDDAHTYQFVHAARPSTEAAQISTIRNELTAARQAHREALQELAQLQDRVQEVEAQLGTARETVEREWVDLAQARGDLQRAELARQDVQKELKNLRGELTTLRRSNTYRAGLIVRYILRPAEGLRAVNRRRRRRSKSPSTAGAGGKSGKSTAGQVEQAGLSVNTPSHLRGIAPATAIQDLYERALVAESFTSDRKKLAFCVSTKELRSGRGDLYVAVGLGRKMVDHGYEVAYFAPERWDSLPADTDIAVAMLPTLDPTVVPDGCRVVAWVRNETEVWFEHRQLALFDAVFSSSSISMNRIAERYDGPTGLLPLGVDTDLFPLPAAKVKREGVVTTVNQWGQERHLYRSLRDVDISFPFAIFGRRKGLRGYGRYTVGAASYFSLPDVYRRSLIVLDDLNHTTRPYGSVNLRLFESLASGALPITNSRLGLAELGLGDLPTYSDGPSLAVELSAAMANRKETENRARALGAMVRERHSYARRADEFQAELAKVAAEPPRRAVRPLVGFFPDYRVNPYQAMLMSGLPEIGLRSYPVPDVVADPAPHSPTGPLDNYVLHVHWTDPIIHPGTSNEEAAARMERFKANIVDLRSRGGKLVWTIHNVFPHESKYARVERALSQFLAEQADAVHVLNPETPALVGSHYPIPPEKVRVIPHSSYLGRYPEAVSRTVARSHFGLESGEFTFLLFGGIRPYKGLDLLLDAFTMAAEKNRRLRLIVAGKPARSVAMEPIMARCEEHPRVITHFDTVEEDEVQLYLKAADNVVLPYRSILNSGAFHLALSFGRPITAPSLGAFKAALDPRYTTSFEPGDAESLRDALLAATQVRGRSVEMAARRAAAKYRPEDMARDYATLVRELLGHQG